jgi:ADP-ribose pyrophosphatase YjhB (NUDIX family)
MNRWQRCKFKVVGLYLKLYWRIFQPFSVGVRAILINDQEQILLLKHSYGESWYLPGGGVDKGETLTGALARELAEELNLHYKDAPVLLGTYSNHFEGKNDFVSIFVIRNFTLKPQRNLEISHWQFFDPHQLPKKISPGTKKRIAEFKNEKTIDYLW